ncbi:hypothetical protein GH714_027518 [Hevea brasiliensis]|uniref:Uncharacterized protein n=1 Tax=Hevea brasiliensis TaxID=3981 RepID=A0A6A6MLF7_HEVBR|nr:hypothetical protein GH714_027518 [Hevea brasiliensis]
MVSAPLGFEISGFDRTRTWVSQNGVFAFGFLECCQKDDDGFLVGVRWFWMQEDGGFEQLQDEYKHVDMKQSVLYGLYPPQDVHMMLNEKKCKEYCSNDPTCIAATSKNDGSGISTIKRTSFISGYRNPSVPATSFLKVCLVPQAVSAQQSDPHFNPKPIPTLSKGFIDREGDNKKFVGAVALIVFVTVSDNWLFNMEQGQNDGNWQQRFDIAWSCKSPCLFALRVSGMRSSWELKLENVLLDEKLAPKLTDFGLRSLSKRRQLPPRSRRQREISTCLGRCCCKL